MDKIWATIWKYFESFKITLILVYILQFVLAFILLVNSIQTLGINHSQVDPKPTENDEHLEELSVRTEIAIWALEMLAVVVALVGVVRENKYILITCTVLEVIGVFLYIVEFDLCMFVIDSVTTGMTGFYTYLVVLKVRANISV